MDFDCSVLNYIFIINIFIQLKFIHILLNDQDLLTIFPSISLFISISIFISLSLGDWILVFGYNSRWLLILLFSSTLHFTMIFIEIFHKWPYKSSITNFPSGYNLTYFLNSSSSFSHNYFQTMCHKYHSL